MSDICIRHPHAMGLERAREVVDWLIAAFKERYPQALLEVRWNQERTAATVSGRGVKGSFAIGASHLLVEISLGRLLKPLRPQAERKIRDKLEKFFPGS